VIVAWIVHSLTPAARSGPAQPVITGMIAPENVCQVSAVLANRLRVMSAP
jgi:hypothetical protein